ncbi:MAG TPA: MASE1 domain-containing protein, partial [Dongiaceae bacterium]
MTQTETGRPPWRVAISAGWLAECALIAAGYMACFAVGNAFALENGISVVWPPSGFALAVLLRFGIRSIVPIWIGDTLANLLWAGMPPSTALLMPSLTVAEPLLGVLLLRLVGFDSALRRLRDIAALILVGAPISTLLKAFAAVYLLSASGLTGWNEYWHNVVIFWGGNAGGVLTIAPAVLILSSRAEQDITMRNWIEAG